MTSLSPALDAWLDDFATTARTVPWRLSNGRLRVAEPSGFCPLQHDWDSRMEAMGAPAVTRLSPAYVQAGILTPPQVALVMRAADYAPPYDGQGDAVALASIRARLLAACGLKETH